MGGELDQQQNFAGEESAKISETVSVSPTTESASSSPPQMLSPQIMPLRKFLFYWLAAILLCAGFAEFFNEWSPLPDNAGYFTIIGLFALTGVAAFSDAAIRKIPNRFSYAAIISALLLTLFIAPVCEWLNFTATLKWLGVNSGGWGGVAGESLKGFFLCAVIGVVSFAARGLGGGDVKILAAVGALAGWQLSISILLNTLMVAFVVGVVNFILRGVLFANLQILLIHVYSFIFMRNFRSALRFKNSESPFCLSLFIGLALLHFVNVHAWLSEFLPFLGAR